MLLMEVRESSLKKKLFEEIAGDVRYVRGGKGRGNERKKKKKVWFSY